MARPLRVGLAILLALASSTGVNAAKCYQYLSQQDYPTCLQLDSNLVLHYRTVMDDGEAAQVLKTVMDAGGPVSCCRRLSAVRAADSSCLRAWFGLLGVLRVLQPGRAMRPWPASAARLPSPSCLPTLPPPPKLKPRLHRLFLTNMNGRQPELMPAQTCTPAVHAWCERKTAHFRPVLLPRAPAPPPAGVETLELAPDGDGYMSWVSIGISDVGMNVRNLMAIAPWGRMGRHYGYTKGCGTFPGVFAEVGHRVRSLNGDPEPLAT